MYGSEHHLGTRRSTCLTEAIGVSNAAYCAGALMVSSCSIVRAAVVQAAPIAFDTEATLEKVDGLTCRAAGDGAELIVFPEAYVSAYPRGSTFGTVVGNRTPEGREQYRMYWNSAVDVPGPAVDRLAGIARKNRVHLVIGVVERDGGTLYCSVLFFGARWNTRR